jgi:hypothetical protein
MRDIPEHKRDRIMFILLAAIRDEIEHLNGQKFEQCQCMEP